MFDTTQEIDIRVTAPEGDKNVTVRFPNDEELAARSAKTKLVVRQLSRGKSMTEPQANEKLDLELFEKIKVSGAELDEYEAAQVIGRLVRCEVTDSAREGNTFRVDLKVHGAETMHILKIPSARQAQQYGRQAISVIEGRHGLQEMKLNLSAAAKLYDDLVISAEGYAGVTPLPHKSAVISEIMTLLNQDEDEIDEGF
jgi:hypothetical protein